jgi:hypothetical protein
MLDYLGMRSGRCCESRRISRQEGRHLSANLRNIKAPWGVCSGVVCRLQPPNPVPETLDSNAGLFRNVSGRRLRALKDCRQGRHPELLTLCSGQAPGCVLQCGAAVTQLWFQETWTAMLDFI